MQVFLCLPPPILPTSPHSGSNPPIPPKTKMELMIPSPATDFNFDSNCTSPYETAPSSPRPITTATFLSVPSSPARSSSSSASVPFTWEERPGTPKSNDDDNFQFDFSGQLDAAIALPADQLFDGGKIRPLKPPPKFHYNLTAQPPSPKSPTRFIRDSLSPRRRKHHADFDPFTAAMEETRRENPTRGRNRPSNPPPGPRRNKPSRSLSPFRASDLLFDPDPDPDLNKSNTGSIFSLSFWYKNWKIKDLLLFRSASESRAKPRRKQEDVRNSSFRSTDSAGSTSNRRRSAHELHYTANRAVSEELKRRTPLPYRQGFLGCLGFHPPCPELSRG